MIRVPRKWLAVAAIVIGVLVIISVTGRANSAIDTKTNVPPGDGKDTNKDGIIDQNDIAPTPPSEPVKLGTVEVRLTAVYTDGTKKVLTEAFSFFGLLTVTVEGKSVQAFLYEAWYTPEYDTVIWTGTKVVAEAQQTGSTIKTWTYIPPASSAVIGPGEKANIIGLVGLGWPLLSSSIDAALSAGSYRFTWTLNLFIKFPSEDAPRAFDVSYPMLDVTISKPTTTGGTTGGGTGTKGIYYMTVVPTALTAQER